MGHQRSARLVAGQGLLPTCAPSSTSGLPALDTPRILMLCDSERETGFGEHRGDAVRGAGRCGSPSLARGRPRCSSSATPGSRGVLPRRPLRRCGFPRGSSGFPPPPSVHRTVSYLRSRGERRGMPRRSPGPWTRSHAPHCVPAVPRAWASRSASSRDASARWVRAPLREAQHEPGVPRPEEPNPAAPSTVRAVGRGGAGAYLCPRLRRTSLPAPNSYRRPPTPKWRAHPAFRSAARAEARGQRPDPGGWLSTRGGCNPGALLCPECLPRGSRGSGRPPGRQQSRRAEGPARRPGSAGGGQVVKIIKKMINASSSAFSPKNSKGWNLSGPPNPAERGAPGPPTARPLGLETPSSPRAVLPDARGQQGTPAGALRPVTAGTPGAPTPPRRLSPGTPPARRGPDTHCRRCFPGCR